MSSDEEEPTTPVLPKDSDRGSSVSSELQVIQKVFQKIKMRFYALTFIWQLVIFYSVTEKKSQALLSITRFHDKFRES